MVYCAICHFLYSHMFNMPKPTLTIGFTCVNVNYFNGSKYIKIIIWAFDEEWVYTHTHTHTHTIHEAGLNC